MQGQGGNVAQFKIQYNYGIMHFSYKTHRNYNEQINIM